MNWDIFLKIYKNLGYSESGLCLGITMRWIEAILLGEEEKFINRLELINQINPDEVLDAKVDLFTNEILPFLDSCHLYANPDQYSSSIFNTTYILQYSFDRSSMIAGSDKILALEGLKNVFSDVIFEDINGIKSYLDNFHDFCQDKNSKPIAILLGNDIHAMGLAYIPAVGWKFFDVNQGIQTFSFEDTLLLAKKIAFGFELTYKSNINPKFFGFYSSGVLPTQDSRCEDLKHFHKKNNYSQNFYRVSQYELVQFANLAALLGYDNIISELSNSTSINFNLTSPMLKTSTVPFNAAQNGHANVIAELAKQPDVNFNIQRPDGATAAHVAAQEGHANVIAELAKRPDVDFNIQTPGGATAAFIAASHGYANIIAELAKRPEVNFNIQMPDGGTAAHIGAQKGHANVIAELAKRPDVNFNIQVPGGATAIYLAAQDGYANVIAELAKRPDVDLEIPTKHGFTPASIAIIEGHLPVLKVLHEHGVNFQEAFLELPMIILFTIAKMKNNEKNINKILPSIDNGSANRELLSTKLIKISLYELAEILEQVEICQYLLECSQGAEFGVRTNTC